LTGILAKNLSNGLNYLDVDPKKNIVFIIFLSLS